MEMTKQPEVRVGKLGTAERDLVTLGVATGAIILFIGTGGTVLPDVVRSLLGNSRAPDLVLVNALLLNIALIIFGWRRYRQLTNEIAERRIAEVAAQQLAETDPLTECLNRRSLATRGANLLSACKADGDGVATIVIDVDNFKQINDIHGHAVGDQVLITFAKRLRRHLPQGSLLARTGGDEFACLVRLEDGKTQPLDELVSWLFRTINAVMNLDGVLVDTTMSVGVATSLDETDESVVFADDLSPDILLNRADIAMYQAKKRGKNRHVLFEAQMEHDLRFRNDLEIGIRNGVEAGQFVPFYEQQIDIVTGELLGFEMLARWESPELGMVSPEIFIPVAEEIGVISALSEGLMEQAFADAMSWDSALTLSVNISPIQLRDPWFSQKLLKLLVKYNFPPTRLEIEITESCLHDNMVMVRSIISSLRNLGIKVSLDDFGTGYSSLSQLRSLPFDRIKIDRSFVSELRDTDASSRIIDSIVSLGEGLNLPITAEGIEDEEILATLKDLGQFKGQGYLYGRPEDSTQVHKRLERLGKLNEGDEPPQELPSALAELLDAPVPIPVPSQGHASA
jgi:diguanylate cyclase (GGDEF)-like protein